MHSPSLIVFLLSATLLINLYVVDNKTTTTTEKSNNARINQSQTNQTNSQHSRHQTSAPIIKLHQIHEESLKNNNYNDNQKKATVDNDLRMTYEQTTSSISQHRSKRIINDTTTNKSKSNSSSIDVTDKFYYWKVSFFMLFVDSLIEKLQIESKRIQLTTSYLLTTIIACSFSLDKLLPQL